jgi:heme-degrading monooxygenase HmoA
MYARIISGLIRPDKREETISIFRDKLIPRAKAQEGFNELFLLLDSKTNKFHIITLWETEKHMSAGERTMYLVKQLGSIVSHFAEPPTTERFEIMVKS